VHRISAVALHENLRITESIITPMVASKMHPTMFSRDRLLSAATDINLAIAAPHHAEPAIPSTLPNLFFYGSVLTL
jgi:hypothetical protein